MKLQFHKLEELIFFVWKYLLIFFYFFKIVKKENTEREMKEKENEQELINE